MLLRQRHTSTASVVNRHGGRGTASMSLLMCPSIAIGRSTLQRIATLTSGARLLCYATLPCVATLTSGARLPCRATLLCLATFLCYATLLCGSKLLCYAKLLCTGRCGRNESCVHRLLRARANPAQNFGKNFGVGPPGKFAQNFGRIFGEFCGDCGLIKEKSSGAQAPEPDVLAAGYLSRCQMLNA